MHPNIFKKIIWRLRMDSQAPQKPLLSINPITHNPHLELLEI